MTDIYEEVGKLNDAMRRQADAIDAKIRADSDARKATNAIGRAIVPDGAPCDEEHTFEAPGGVRIIATRWMGGEYRLRFESPPKEVHVD